MVRRLLVLSWPTTEHRSVYRLNQKTVRWKQAISSRFNAKSGSRDKDASTRNAMLQFLVLVDGVLHCCWASLSVSAVVFKCLGRENRYKWGENSDSPCAAAQLHLDCSHSESQACFPHCPDPYRRNCFPVREEHCSGAASSASCRPHRGRRRAPIGDSGGSRLLARCQKRLQLLLCQLDLHSGTPCLRVVSLNVLNEQATAGWTDMCRRSRCHRSSSQERLRDSI